MGNDVPTELPAHLADTLEALGYAESEGLLTVSNVSEPGSRDYYWRELRDKIGLDAVFFNDGVPVVGFSSEEEPNGLHGVRKRLWNYGRVPLLINVSMDTISAYNAATSVPSVTRPAVSGSIYSEHRQNIASQLLRVFQRSQIESGRFNFASGPMNRRAGRVDRALLRNLAYLREGTAQLATTRRDALDTLIGGFLVASYLRDRGILNSDHMDSLVGIPELNDVLTRGVSTTRTLFEGLAARFNGDVFGSVPEAMSEIEGVELEGIASMLRGDDLATGQQALWPYDFSVLPADLVSSVYEELLAQTRKEDSAYYTPRFLVDLVLDEILPWSADRATFRPPRIADIACGSGAFMIEAFRRIAYLRHAQTGQPLTYPELNDLLLTNIHGVDHNPVAAKVAAFGLYLSVLEEVHPPDIWDKALLPKLIGRNIIVADAFADHALRNERFDLVVSNPPWSSNLTPLATKYVRATDVPVADQQLAQAFVWLARDMLKSGGRLGLVMPAKGLLHNRSNTAQSFRSSLFTKLDVTAIIDLSAVRRSVFVTAIAPSAVLVARRPDDNVDEVASTNTLLHVAAHPRALGSPVDALIIAPEEIRPITKRQAASRPDIWKVLLWGSTRDLELIDRLRRSYPSVGGVAQRRGWQSSQGFQVGGGDSNDSTDLIGLPIVETKSVQFLHISQDNYDAFDRKKLHRPRRRELYSGPMVLIRRGIHKEGIAASYREEDAVFPNGLIGIAGNKTDRAELASLAVTTVSSLGRYWHFMTSASWGVERDFVELNEHLSLPLASPDEETARRLFELIRLAEQDDGPELRDAVDSIVFDMYGLSSVDRARIIEKMQTAIGRFYGHSLGIEKRPEDASGYQSVLTRALQTTLPDLSVTTHIFDDGPYRAVTITLDEDDFANSISHSTGPVDVDMDLLLRRITRSTTNPTAIIAQPSGFFVDENTVYLIKTNERDRWSNDSALDDAERVLAALATGI